MNDLDKDLEAAVEADLGARIQNTAAPYTAGRAERLRVLKNADAQPNAAMDQFASPSRAC